MNPPEKIFLALTLARVARSQFTRPCVSTIPHMTYKGVQTSLTSAHDLISWLLPLKMTTLTLTNMAASLTYLLSPFTTREQRNLPEGPGDRKFKSSGCVGLSKTLLIRMGSLVFESLGWNLLSQTGQLNGTVSSPPLMSCVLLISFLPLHGTSWKINLVMKILMQSASLKRIGTIII